MKKENARSCALKILIEFEQKKAYSNLLLNHSLKQYALSERDRRLVTEFVYGVIQRLNTLDWVADQFIKKGIDSLQPWVRLVIRLGLYQLMYLDRIPDRAAVYETVQLAKRWGHPGVVKLVNGVLRTYLRKKGDLSFPTIAIQYSVPSWMANRMIEIFGRDEAIQMMKSNLQPPKVCIRVNRLKTDLNQMLERFSGHAEPSPIAKDGLIVKRAGNPADHKWYKEGYYTVQDESSMLVADALRPVAGMNIFDACAAPGGKTTHLAERMNNEGTIVACDQYQHKVNLIEAHAERLGIDIIETKTVDVRQFRVEQQFDAVLLDAPCSGLGVISRRPEIKWRKEDKDMQSLIQLQRQLLDVCASYVKPEGVLIYSTCTWEPRENQEQVRQFLNRHEEFMLDSRLSEYLPKAVIEKAMLEEGMVQILPHHFQSDGFFIARLIRRSA